MTEAFFKGVSLQWLHNEADACYDRARECERLGKSFSAWLFGQRDHWYAEARYWNTQRERWRQLIYEIQEAMKPPKEIVSD